MGPREAGVGEDTRLLASSARSSVPIPQA
jgi:hypothetical protein